jgi:exopolysaccharide production protein ExoZ
VIANIQVLRALAAYLVVLVHLPALVRMAGGPDEPFVFGNAGVDLFFVISGFIMVFTTSGRAITAKEFLAHRLARVVPLYWLITALVFALALVAPWMFQAIHADLSSFAKSLLFVPFRRANDTVMPIVFVGWTLNYEMFFYLIFSATLLFKERAVGLLIAVSLLLGLVLAGNIANPSRLEIRFYTQPILLEFTYGIGIGLLFPYLQKWRYLRWPAALLSCVALSAFLWAPLVWPELDRAVVYGIPAFIVVLSAVLIERAGTRATQPLLQLLGEASYSIYLTHFFVTRAVVKAAERIHWDGIMPMIGFLCLSLFGVSLVGVLTHLWIEKPLTNVARRSLGIGSKVPAYREMKSHAR